MDLKKIAPDHFIQSWNKGRGVTARAAELLHARGLGVHRLDAIEEHVELLRSRGLGLRPFRERGQFIPEDVFMSTAWERCRLVCKKRARRWETLDKLMPSFCIAWEMSDSLDAAIEEWKARSGKTVRRQTFLKLATFYRNIGVNLKLTH